MKSALRILGKMTWVELKLFMREPITMAFTFALPVIFLVVMGGVFGNTPDPEGRVYGGVGPLNYYTPAYIAMVISSIGVVGLPVHIAAYRERRVLRRLRASSLSVWTVLGSQVLVSFVIAVLGSILLSAISFIAYDADFPKQFGLFIPAFVLGTISFSAFGFFLGAVLPTTRAAQGIGIILFFVMLILGGAGPPREVFEHRYENHRRCHARLVRHPVTSGPMAWQRLKHGCIADCGRHYRGSDPAFSAFLPLGMRDKS